MNTLLGINKQKELPITSKDLALNEIVEEGMSFNVPIYQRLYVWGDEQIRTLLEDIDSAFRDKPESTYYLGGILLTSSKEPGNTFDLIDGQQRFTTLWLISLILKEPELSSFAYSSADEEKQPRMTFAVRDHANTYFKIGKRPSGLSKSDIEELEPIENASSIIENYVANHDNKAGLAKFIYSQVIFVVTELPAEMDENKIFEASNNRGVQLEQHQILKSKLLSKVDSTLRHSYSLIWDACSIMDEYLEKNIKSVANLQWKDLFSDNTGLEKENHLPKNILENLERSRSTNGEEKKLLAILCSVLTQEEEKALEQDEKDDVTEYDSGKVESIITFPMLLLHTLRIHQYRYKGVRDSVKSAPVKEKELIKIFDTHFSATADNSSVTSFFDLLWEVRGKFDEFVIKWSFENDDSDKIHLIKKLSRNEKAFQRSAPTSSEKFTLLQSMLYHSQEITTHYWLTPFLNKMLDSPSREDLYRYLIKLDDTMFCRKHEKEQDLRKLSFDLLSCKEEDLGGDAAFVEKKLCKPLGTKFPSYWFYKTEYILWMNRERLGKKDEWQDFRITAKNSVEHISPQKPKEYDANTIWDKSDSKKEKCKKLNDFGNLVLLSTGMNSEYSNKTFLNKRLDHRQKNRVEPLKSELIFENNSWNWEKCVAHRNQIICLFKEYIYM